MSDLTDLRAVWQGADIDDARYFRRLHNLKNEWRELFDVIMALLYPEDEGDIFPSFVCDDDFPEPEIDDILLPHEPPVTKTMDLHPDLDDPHTFIPRPEGASVVERIIEARRAGRKDVMEDLRDYLDDAIERWREINRTPEHEFQSIAAYYVDAFQSVRQTLLGDLLPPPEAALLESL